MKNKKIDEKIIKFNKTFGDTIQYVNARCDEGDYVSALAALDFYAEKPYSNPDVYAHIADIYTEIFNYDLAIKYWLIYIVNSPKKYLSDGYNGLGANYYLKGDAERAAYHFNLQFSYPDADDCIYNDILEEFTEKQSALLKSKIKVVSDGKKSEKSILDELMSLNDEKRYDDILPVAESLFDSENEDVRNEALYVAAYAEYRRDRLKKAKDLVFKIINQSANVDCKAYVLGAYICAALGYFKKAADTAEFTVDSLADENNAARHVSLLYHFIGKNEAKKTVEKYSAEYPYNSDVAFCMGVIAYNDGDFARAKKEFDKAYYFSRSYVTLFYARMSAICAERNSCYDGIEKLEMFIRLPQVEFDRNIEIISDFLEEKRNVADFDLQQLDYLFDFAVFNYGIMAKTFFALICLNGTAKQKHLLKIKLTSPYIPDDFKAEIVPLLCLSGEQGQVAVTYSGYTHWIIIEMPSFQERGQKIFREAYMHAIAICSYAAPDETEKLFLGALDLQREIVKLRNVGKIPDDFTLACAICVYSKINFGELGKDLAYELFRTTKAEVAKILTLAGVFCNDKR